MKRSFIFLLSFVNFHTICSLHQFLKHTGTKTPYRVVANTNDEEIKFEGCKATKIWMMIRHGTRLPSKEVINAMNNKLPVIRDNIINNISNGELTDQQIKGLRNWTSSLNERDEKTLTVEGEEEMTQLAERMQTRFPEVLSQIYSDTSYKFKFTKSQRTEESAKSFTTGLFGRCTSNSVMYPEPLQRDPILRFYKLCNKWRNDIKKNPAGVKEKHLFVKTPIVKNAIEIINKRLGLPDSQLLKFEDILLIYTTCAFESAWKNDLSPWCAAFTKETLQVIEYSEDLKYYWIDGYGYKITYKQACPAIKNMVDLFEDPNPYPKAVIYFTHSGTILKLLAHLGLYKDEEELRHDNYYQQIDRKWRVSQIDAFGSNIAVVLLECEKTKKLVFMHQEEIIELPDLPKLCDFQLFLNKYHDSIHYCNFNEMCGL